MAGKRRGAPYGNKNAIGNKGGGAPLKNQNAMTHGLFSKHLTEDMLELYDAIDNFTLLDILWDNIRLAYIAIVRAHKIMYIANRDEVVREAKKIHYDSETSEIKEIEWEVQFAWDRMATFLNVQARAQTALRKLLKQYDEMLHKNWDLEIEEQKVRIGLMKAQSNKYIRNSQDNEIGIDWIELVLNGDEGKKY